MLVLDPVGAHLARLLVDVFGVARHRRHGAWRFCCDLRAWWTTKEEALADAAPYTVRSVLVPAASREKGIPNKNTTHFSHMTKRSHDSDCGMWGLHDPYVKGGGAARPRS